MKLIEISKWWISLLELLTIIFIFTLTIQQVHNKSIYKLAPWSDPHVNPCASLKTEWLHIQWKPLNRCFKLFKIGHPCPPTQELVPFETTLKLMQIYGIHATCKCPPRTVVLFGSCVPLFQKGPCDEGEFVQRKKEQLKNNTSSIGSGVCEKFDKCAPNMVYWPRANKCFHTYTKGPCLKGKLIVSEYGLGICKCNKEELNYYYDYNNTKSCYEYYTRGPCTRIGQLYLPGGKCGCRPHLPHYYFENGQCYELGTEGPCGQNAIYTILVDDKSQFKHGKCICKDGYIRWSYDGLCYGLYTRGPCLLGQFLIDESTCIRFACDKGQLYFPKEKNCFDVDKQGPCPENEVITFDFRIRPSIGGLSFNGICGCSNSFNNTNNSCIQKKKVRLNNNCNVKGMGKINAECYKLYTRGPCFENQWVKPMQDININNKKILTNAKCECNLEWDETYKEECTQINKKQIEYNLTIEHTTKKIIKIVKVETTTESSTLRLDVEEETEKTTEETKIEIHNEEEGILVPIIKKELFMNSDGDDYDSVSVEILSELTSPAALLFWAKEGEDE